MNGDEATSGCRDKNVINWRLGLKPHPQRKNFTQTQGMVDRPLADDSQAEKGTELRLKTEPARSRSAAA